MIDVVDGYLKVPAVFGFFRGFWFLGPKLIMELGICGRSNCKKNLSSTRINADEFKKALKEILEEENSELIRVIKDCPYIPIRSLDGIDGAVYKDGEYIYLSKIGKTFKVLGSFHIVRDTDLNLATCYALGIEKEPSLILPEVVLKQLE